MKDKNQFSLRQWFLIGFALLFLVWFGFHSQSFGATYYVKIGGNDTNAGTSWATAWVTITKVNSSTSVGDTVNTGNCGDDAFTVGFPYTTLECQSSFIIDSNMYYVATFSGWCLPDGGNNWTHWKTTCGFDVRGSNGVNPGFTNPGSGDFSRSSSSQEMNVTYGGKTWTRFGAWQPAETIATPGTRCLFRK